MLQASSSRIIAITFIMTAFSAIVVGGYWGSGFGFSLSAAREETAQDQETTVMASQPRVMTTPLNAITSFDAVAIARHIAGTSPFVNVNQFCAADVSNNGAISAVDPSLIARYVVNIPPTGLTGTVVPPPCHANYQTSIPVLKGEVTGQDPVITGGVPGTVAVSLPAISATPGTVIFPITIGNTTSMDIKSFDLQISFDPTVITPAAVPVDAAGTLSSTVSVTANSSISGHLIVSGFRSTALSGSGALLNLRFNIIGIAGQSTALTFEDYTDPDNRAHQGSLFNEGTPSAAPTNGSVTIPSVSPTSTLTATGTPTPVTALNAITSFDMAVIERHIAGTSPLPTNNHKCAADVVNDGAISGVDLYVISRYVLGVYPWGVTGTVVQPPCSDQWPTNVAVLKGDPSGTEPKITGGVPGTVAVSMPAVVSPKGSILIPVIVGDTTGMDISSYDLQVSYDATVIKPQLQSWTVDQAGSLSTGMTFFVNTPTSPSSPGHFIISASQAAPLTGAGTLLRLRFNLVGTPGSSTVLTLENYTDSSNRAHQSFLFNEGVPSAQTANGSIFISSSSPTATSTPSNTATPTPTNTPVSTLGNYPDKVTGLSTQTTVTPDTSPVNTTSMSVTADTNFLGLLEGDPVSGIVRVTNANPAGMHLITVRAFDLNGNSSTRTFALTVTPASGCNPVAFASPAYFPGVGVEGSTAAVGDFNRDGKQDLVISNNESVDLEVLLGNGTGGFAFPASVPAGNGFIESVAVGDFNGDGKQDLVTADYYNAVVLLGDGTGNFGTPIILETGIGPRFVAVGDFNNDGKDDIAVVDQAPNEILILLGDGAGGFSAPLGVGFGVSPLYVAAGDFNHDGNQDLAVANGGGVPERGLWVLLGNGRGSFSAATDYPAGGAVAVGNFNGDNNQDILIGGSLRLGDGIGGFGSSNGIGDGGSESIGLGDFNGDAKLDIAFPNNGRVSILLGNGAGGFSSGGTFNAGTFIRSVAVGDFDGDGYQDIAATDGGGADGTPGLRVLLRDCTISIRGTVTYLNAIGNPTTRPVSNVRITGTGAPNVVGLSNFPFGDYALSGFGAGSYLVSPDLAGQVNGAITSFDAAKIAQHVVGTVFLSSNQAAVADVSDNGTISSFDAAQIARYVASLPPFGSTGIWRFNPVSRSYASVAVGVSGEDYKALLMGEVSGNWTNTQRMKNGTERSDAGPIQAGSSKGDIIVNIPNLATARGKEIIIPLNVRGAARKDVISYEFDLRYDPLVIQPLGNAADLKETASRGLSVVTNASQPGLLRVVVYGAMPIDEDGVLLNLRFAAVGLAGSVSPLTFERVMFNEGEPRVIIIGGQVELF